jgi:hypothetical protein
MTTRGADGVAVPFVEILQRNSHWVMDRTPSSHEGITAALPSRQMFSSLVGADAQFSKGF